MFKLKTNEARSFNNTLSAIGIALAILAMILVLDWTARQFMAQVPPFAFPVPADVCVIQWTPRILSQNTATRTQTYLRNDGARVTVAYDYDRFTGAVIERDRETWFNGECSEAALKGRG